MLRVLLRQVALGDVFAFRGDASTAASFVSLAVVATPRQKKHSERCGVPLVLVLFPKFQMMTPEQLRQMIEDILGDADSTSRFLYEQATTGLLALIHDEKISAATEAIDNIMNYEGEGENEEEILDDILLNMFPPAA